jgi:hypothetical protein
MQIFYQQATEFLSRKIPNEKEEPYGVMFLMDEFPTLGKMEQFKAGIAHFLIFLIGLNIASICGKDATKRRSKYSGCVEETLDTSTPNISASELIRILSYTPTGSACSMCCISSEKLIEYGNPRFTKIDTKIPTTRLTSSLVNMVNPTFQPQGQKTCFFATIKSKC